MIDALISDIGALPILASSYQGSSSDGPSLSTVVLGAASKNPIQTEAPEPTTLAEAQPLLPKHSTAQKLAHHYITNIYPRLPFFSIQGFWTQFEYVYSTATQEVPPSTNTASASQDPAALLSPERLDHTAGSVNHGYSCFTVLIVLAIATSSLSRSTDSIISNNAERLFHAALLFRESAILPNTVVGVQSILFLIQYTTLNPSSLNAWYLIGVGIRLCTDLGLHQDPQPLGSTPPSLLETRRRLWWSMYSFDRSMSIGLGRPREISDNVIGAELPSFQIGSTASEVEISGYLQRYRILQLQSLIYDGLNTTPEQPDRSTDQTLADLRDKLNSWAHNNSPLHTQELVESEYLMGMMLLCRPCRLIPQRTPEELLELWNSALNFARIYRTLAESNGIFYVQIASEKVYWTGLAMLFVYWKLRTGPIRPIELWMAVKDVTFILRTLAERWEEGKVLGENFEKTSAKVIELIEGVSSQGGQGITTEIDSAMPDEVKSFHRYSSLTSIWTADRVGGYPGASPQSEDMLQSLIAEIVRG